MFAAKSDLFIKSKSSFNRIVTQFGGKKLFSLMENVCSKVMIMESL